MLWIEIILSADSVGSMNKTMIILCYLHVSVVVVSSTSITIALNTGFRPKE